MQTFKTMREIMEEQGYQPRFVNPDIRTMMEVGVGIFEIEKNGLGGVNVDELYASEPILSIADKRLNVIRDDKDVISDNVSKFIPLLVALYDISSPGGVVVMMIDVVEQITRQQKAMTLQEIVISIYPDGFYDSETMTHIIDDIMKPRLSMLSNYY